MKEERKWVRREQEKDKFYPTDKEMEELLEGKNQLEKKEVIKNEGNNPNYTRN